MDRSDPTAQGQTLSAGPPIVAVPGGTPQGGPGAGSDDATPQIADSRAFWAQVGRPADACWEWRGTLDGKGYGKIPVGGRLIGAHRIAYTLAVGPIPPGIFVCHECDNPPCCNPNHLFLGTAADNNRDTVLKGRARRNAARGEANPQAKLTEAKVRAIRADPRPGHLIAADYGVGTTTVHRIKHREDWAHVSDDGHPQ